MYLSTATRARGRRRAFVALVAVGVGVGLLLAAAGVLALSQRDELPANTFVGGADVSGMTRTEAAAAIGATFREQRLRPVVLHLDASRTTVTVTGALLGARPRIDQALDQAEATGLGSRLTRRLGLGEVRIVPLRYDFEPDQLQRLESELEARVATEPREARLTVAARGAHVRPSVPGQSLDLEGLLRRLRSLPPTVSVPVEVVQPSLTTAEAREAGHQIDALLAAPRGVAIGATSARLTPAFLRRALVIEPNDGEFVVSLDQQAVLRRLRPVFRDRLRTARDAAFRVEGRHVTIIRSAPGRELDVRAITRSLLASPDSRVHRARFRSVAPSLTTQEARGLGIRELVSEFTTYYPCCASRVTNIQRAAQLLDGTVVRPGGRFSLNEALGERTTERGFVSAPQIMAGRLEDAIGGGVSQVATTFYNAAFFAGLRLDAHQAHQFYISRYPMGREATVSWGGPELIFTNDWKAGLLIKVSAWSTGISVRFYSSKLGRRIETVTEEPYSYREPTTHLVKNPALKPGERKVVQEAGPAGFSVEYTRKVYRGDDLIKDERYRTRYDPENEYVEVGPKKKPKPKPKPVETPKSPTTPTDPGETTETPPTDGGTTTTG